MGQGIYDLIVIGAGPGGYEAAACAGRMGKKTALVEKEYIGGTCLNVGCIPTKTLLRSSRLFAECKNAAAYGVEVPSVEFNLGAAVQRKNRVVATLTRGVESLLKRSGVEIIRGHARLASKNSVQVGADTYTAKNILIATGARPAVLPVPGIDSKCVLDSTASRLVGATGRSPGDGSRSIMKCRGTKTHVMIWAIMKSDIPEPYFGAIRATCRSPLHGSSQLEPS